MRVGRVAGIQIILNNWFIVLLVLFALAGMAGKVAVVFSAVLIHEGAHAVVAKLLGYTVKEVELLPFGGVARISRLSEAGARNEIAMAAAGPAASVGLAAASYLARLYFFPGSEALTFYWECNVMLAAVNMLPALPLDGGRILRAVLSLYMEYGTATAITAKVSTWIGVLLAGKAVYDSIFGGYINISFFIIAIFLYAAAKSEVKVAGYRTMRVMANKKAELAAKGFLPTTHYTAVQNAAVRELVRLFGPDRYYVILVVDESCRVCGTLTETEIWEALPHKGFHTKVGDLLT